MKSKIVFRTATLLLIATFALFVFTSNTQFTKETRKENGMQSTLDKAVEKEPKGEKPKTTHKAVKAEPVAIVIYCSDPRFQEAFGEFIKKNLGLQQGWFVPIVLAGGPGALAHEEEFPEKFQGIRKDVLFFAGHFPSIMSVIVINHEDCGFYKKIPGRPNEKSDLKIIADILRKQIPQLQVKTVYAGFTGLDHSGIVFEEP